MICQNGKLQKLKNRYQVENEWLVSGKLYCFSSVSFTLNFVTGINVISPPFKLMLTSSLITFFKLLCEILVLFNI